MKILSITFETNAQNHRDGQFTVPKQVCDLLGLNPGDEISLLIKTATGTSDVVKILSSGTEIYGTDISDLVKAGEKITVTAKNN